MIFGRIFEWILQWAREHRFFATTGALLLLAVSFLAGACGRIFGVPGLK